MRHATLLATLAIGCTHPFAYIPGAECFIVPGEYVPGTSTDTGLENMSSAHLRELGEPILWTAAAYPPRTVRLFVAPHDHPPIAIRLEERSGALELRAATYPGAGGWCPGDFSLFERKFGAHHSTRTATLQEWTEVEGLLRSFQFWQLPSLEEPPDPASETVIIRLHATSYLLEVREPRGYHFLSREGGASALEASAFARLCKRLIALSGLALEAPEAYCPAIGHGPDA